MGRARPGDQGPEARPEPGPDRRRGRRDRRRRRPRGGLDEPRRERARVLRDVALPLRRVQAGAARPDGRRRAGDGPGRRSRRGLARGTVTLGVGHGRGDARPPVGGPGPDLRPAARAPLGGLVRGCAGHDARDGPRRGGEGVDRDDAGRLCPQPGDHHGRRPGALPRRRRHPARCDARLPRHPARAHRRRPLPRAARPARRRRLRPRRPAGRRVRLRPGTDPRRGRGADPRTGAPA